MASLFQRAVKFLSVVEENLLQKIYFRFPPESFIPALVNIPLYEKNSYRRKSLTEILEESFLWAVPKRRRSIEKRRCRRFGVLKYFYKPLLPKTNILICSECGSYKEAGLLCPNCYSKIKAVTTEMQEAIEKQLGISPVENEVVVVYSNDEPNPEFYKLGAGGIETKPALEWEGLTEGWKHTYDARLNALKQSSGKRIVEIKKERPKIFCDNLLQRSTQGPSTSSEVIPKKDLS